MKWCAHKIFSLNREKCTRRQKRFGWRLKVQKCCYVDTWVRVVSALPTISVAQYPRRRLQANCRSLCGGFIHFTTCSLWCEVLPDNRNKRQILPHRRVAIHLSTRKRCNVVSKPTVEHSSHTPPPRHAASTPTQGPLVQCYFGVYRTSISWWVGAVLHGLVADYHHIIPMPVRGYCGLCFARQRLLAHVRLTGPRKPM